MAPDLGTLEDPVLVTLQDLPECPCTGSVGRTRNFTLGTIARLAQILCEIYPTREERVNLPPGFSFWASFMNSFFQILDGETMAEMEGFLSFFPEFGDKKLILAGSCITLQGEANLNLRANFSLIFSQTTSLMATKFSLRLLCTLMMF